MRRITFPECANAPLGFGSEIWKSDYRIYEGFDQLKARQHALGRKTKKLDVIYNLTGQLLSDVIIAAGGVEDSVLRLRAAVADLQGVASRHQLRATDGVPHGLSDPAAIAAWYALADLFTWSRTVVERMERPAGDRRRYPKQGLLPALKPKRLGKRCAVLFETLAKGPVGRSRNLCNFVLHTSLVRHPYSGVSVDSNGRVTLPVPDLPTKPISHWYLLTWTRELEGLDLAESIWDSVKAFVDGLIGAFEAAVPRRMRRAP